MSDFFMIDPGTRSVQSGGGTIVLPKILIPTVGYIRFSQDTEGNAPECRADQ